MERGNRILVVEDDAQVARTLSLALRDAGYHVDGVSDGDAALDCAARSPHDLVILDLMLPGKSGLEVLRAMRQRGDSVAVLILTARGAEADRVAGLDAGADDYLVKPFGVDEFLARVRALLRRPSDLAPNLRVADLEMNLVSRAVFRNAHRIQLTNREFELLEFFFRRLDQVVTRAELASGVWGYNFDPMSNIVDVHIAHLRSKIDADSQVKLLVTVRGQGYMLKTPAESNGAR
jgi:DNA-binding response OmpR family regulator